MQFKGSLKVLPEASKILITISVVLFMTVISWLPAGGLIYLFFRINIFSNPAILNDLRNPQVVDASKLFQLIAAIFTFIISAIIAAFLFSDSVKKYLQLNAVKFRSSLFAILLIVVIGPFINWMADVNSLMHLPAFLHGLEQWMKETEAHGAELTNAFVATNNPLSLLYTIIVMALVPAIGEEFFFRGLLQKYFCNITRNTHVGILITAIIFSAIHLQFYGFIPRMVLGIILGYLLVWSGSLWLPVIAHFANNAITVLLTNLQQKNQLPFNPDTIGTGKDETLWLLISVVLTILFLWLIKFAGNKTESNLD